MKADFVVKEVLATLQEHGKAVVVGGFIRDRLLGNDFKDVDVVTTCSFEILKKTFPNLDWTETGIEFGVCRSKHKGILFEFSFVKEDDFWSKIIDRDFTINSFYYDGEKLYSLASADEDIEKRILKPVEPFYKHLTHSPKVLLRAFRFASKYNLKMDTSLLSYIEDNKDLISDIPQTRVTEEIYEILKGEYVINALHYMSKTNLIPFNKTLEDKQYIQVPIISDSFKARLVYLNYIVGNNVIESLIDNFKLSPSFKVSIEKNQEVFESNYFDTKRKDFQFILLLKRYQFNDDPKLMKEFLKNNIKKK